MKTTTKYQWLICAPPVTAALYVKSPWLAAAFFGMASAAHQGRSATMDSGGGDIFPNRAVASVVGFGGMLSSFLAMVYFRLLDAFPTRRAAHQID